MSSSPGGRRAAWRGCRYGFRRRSRLNPIEYLFSNKMFGGAANAAPTAMNGNASTMSRSLGSISRMLSNGTNRQMQNVSEALNAPRIPDVRPQKNAAITTGKRQMTGAPSLVSASFITRHSPSADPMQKAIPARVVSLIDKMCSSKRSFRCLSGHATMCSVMQLMLATQARWQCPRVVDIHPIAWISTPEDGAGESVSRISQPSW